jgi:hypothetical protein
MRFRTWLENVAIPPDKISQDYNHPWYHATMRDDKINSILASGRLITRAEGAKRTNAAALGSGIYLFTDLEQRHWYVGGGVRGAVFETSVVGQPRFLRITNSPEDGELWEQLKTIGLNQGPEMVNQLVEGAGYQGIHWDMGDGSQNLVVYQSNLLSPVKMVMEYVPRPNSIDGDWQQIKPGQPKADRAKMSPDLL